LRGPTSTRGDDAAYRRRSVVGFPKAATEFEARFASLTPTTMTRARSSASPIARSRSPPRSRRVRLPPQPPQDQREGLSMRRLLESRRAPCFPMREPVGVLLAKLGLLLAFGLAAIVASVAFQDRPRAEPSQGPKSNIKKQEHERAK